MIIIAIISILPSFLVFKCFLDEDVGGNSAISFIVFAEPPFSLFEKLISLE